MTDNLRSTHTGDHSNSSLGPQDEELADLARLAVTGSTEDMRLFLTRLVRRYAKANPELARRLEGCLAELRRRHGMGILRTSDMQPRPTRPREGDTSPSSASASQCPHGPS